MTQEVLVPVAVPQVQKTVEIAQTGYIDKIVDVPVVLQRQVPAVPHAQFLDRVDDVLVLL